MRAIFFHRRAARYLSRMPKDRAAQVRDALREVASLENIVESTPTSRSWAGIWLGGPA